MKRRDEFINPNQAAILLKLLEGSYKMKDLQNIVKNYLSLQKEIQGLQELELVKVEEIIEGRRSVYVSLTEKGKNVAEEIAKLDSLIKNEGGNTEPFNYLFNFDKAIQSIKYSILYQEKEDENNPLEIAWKNYLEGKRTLEPLLVFKVEDSKISRQIHPEMDPIANYFKKKGKMNTSGAIVALLRYFKNNAQLFCETCRSSKCRHVNFLWANPTTRKLILDYANKKGLKINEFDKETPLEYPSMYL